MQKLIGVCLAQSIEFEGSDHTLRASGGLIVLTCPVNGLDYQTHYDVFQRINRFGSPLNFTEPLSSS